MQPKAGKVTVLLERMRDGDAAAFSLLMPLVYDELRAIAHNRLRYEDANHTLNTTALVHEAYLKLVDQRRTQWKGRSHFFAVAAQAMRRILVNYALQRKTARRGGDAPHVSLNDAIEFRPFEDSQVEEVLAVDELLTRMEPFNERGCRVVEYHFFVGLTYAEIAEVMDLSVPTVRRAWATARMWLQRELRAMQ